MKVSPKFGFLLPVCPEKIQGCSLYIKSLKKIKDIMDFPRATPAEIPTGKRPALKPSDSSA